MAHIHAESLDMPLHGAVVGPTLHETESCLKLAIVGTVLNSVAKLLISPCPGHTTMHHKEHTTGVRVGWYTDTHLDHAQDETVHGFMKELGQYDVVIITGDVSDARNIHRHIEMLQNAGPQVYWVAGNHDYYGGSIHQLRAEFAHRYSVGKAVWLGSCGPVMLGDKCALVGVDGWYDGRNGNFFRSEVELNDFSMIAELSTHNRQERLKRIKALSDACADRLEPLIAEAAELPGVDHIVVATHVAPWEGAAWHMGQPSDKEWQPFFSSRSIGLAIEKAAGLTDKRVTVLCGHSHSPGTFRPNQQITCETGAARYGRPALASWFDL